MSSHHIIHTHPIKHVPGGINPIKRHSYQSVININSKFRDNYSFTDSNDFFIQLPATIKDVVHMKVLNVIIPDSISNISDNNNNNNFYLKLFNPSTNKYIENRIYIPDGTYTGQELAEAINNELANNNFQNINFIYSNNSNKFSIQSKNDFKIDFSYYDRPCNKVNSSFKNQITRDQVTLGWQLGFRGKYLNINSTNGKLTKATPNSLLKPYFNSQIPLQLHCDTKCQGPIDGWKINTDKNGCFIPDPDNFFKYDSIPDYEKSFYYINAETTFDPLYSHYLLLDIDDFNQNHSTGFISPNLDSTLNSNNIMAKIITDDNASRFSPMDAGVERVYFGPTNLSKLQIKLYNEYGILANINRQDWSLTIQLEIIYDS